MISLAPIFTDRFELNQALVAIVNLGTGLGKTYSFGDSARVQIASSPNEPHIFISSAPQKNMLDINANTKKALNDLGCEVLNVRAYTELTDVDHPLNIYHMAKSVFTERAYGNPDQSLRCRREAIDIIGRLTANIEFDDEVEHPPEENNPDDFFYDIKPTKRKPASPTKLIYAIASILNDCNSLYPYMTSLEKQGDSKMASDAKKNLSRKLRNLYADVLTLAEKSYINAEFRLGIESILNTKNIEKTKEVEFIESFRRITKALMPIIHWQFSANPHLFLLSTTSKLLYSFEVARPKVQNYTYTKKKYLLKDLLSSASASNMKNQEWVAEEIKAISVGDLTNINQLKSKPYKLAFARFIIAIDEADLAKEYIADRFLQKKIRDTNLFGANGALTRATSDLLLVDSKHRSLSEVASTAPHNVNLFEHMHRHYGTHRSESYGLINSIDVVRKVRFNLYSNLFESKWPYFECYANPEEAMRDVDHIFRAARVGNTITAKNFKQKTVQNNSLSLGVFGGESFGFLGGDTISDIEVIITRQENSDFYRAVIQDAPHNSPIARKVRAVKLNGEVSYHVPLSLVFLFFCETLLYYQLIVKNFGVNSDPNKMGESSHVKNDQLIHKAMDVAEHPKAFIKELNKINKGKGILANIALPFRKAEDDSGIFLHTATSMMLIRELAHKEAEKIISNGAVLADYLKKSAGEDYEYSESDAVIRPVPVDIDYANKRTCSVFGLLLDFHTSFSLSDKSAFFPIAYRPMSPEGYIDDLLIGAGNRNHQIFLLSATGGFTNSHITSFSTTSLKQLAERSGQYIISTMNDKDMALVGLKRQERAENKTINVRSFSTRSNKWVKKAAISYNSFLESLQSLKRKGVEVEHFGDASDEANERYAQPLYERKRRELERFLEAIYQIAKKDKQSHALALGRTIKPLAKMLEALALQKDKGASLTNTLPFTVKNIWRNSGSVEAGSIFLLEDNPLFCSEGGINPFQKKKQVIRPTLVVAYIGAIEKGLQSELSITLSDNSKASSKLLRNTLGLSYDPYVDEDTANFNAMDYVLHAQHDFNVVIVSSTVSSGRGVNFICRDQPPKPVLKKQISKMQQKNKDKDSRQLQLMQLEMPMPSDNAVEESVSNTNKEWDLDDLFIVSAPFKGPLLIDDIYLDSNTDNDRGKSIEKQQEQFFKRAEHVYWATEEIARRNYNTDNKVLSNIINFGLLAEGEFEPVYSYRDRNINSFFAKQRWISFVQDIIQNAGRFERTNAKQTQTIHLFEGTNDFASEMGVIEAIDLGWSEIVSGLDEAQVKSQKAVLSLASKLIIEESQKLQDDITLARIRDSDSDSSEVYSDFAKTQIAALQDFEEGKSFFLSAIAEYREDKDERPYLEHVMGFYEAFRSYAPLEGCPFNVANFRRYMERSLKAFADVEKNQRHLAIMSKFVKSLFVKFEPDVSYCHLETQLIRVPGFKRANFIFKGSNNTDKQNSFARLPFAIEPAKLEFNLKYEYVAPWVLPDLKGNVGELRLKALIDSLERQGFKQLKRNDHWIAADCFEYADAFLQKDSKLLAIDAKLYSSNHPASTIDKAWENKLSKINFAISKVSDSNFKSVDYLGLNVGEISFEKDSMGKHRSIPNLYVAANKDMIAVSHWLHGVL